MSEMKADDVRAVVREHYGSIARGTNTGCAPGSMSVPSGGAPRSAGWPCLGPAWRSWRAWADARWGIRGVPRDPRPEVPRLCQIADQFLRT
jgi:hypothetical protein